MKTFKTILLMMLFALTTLSSCDKEDFDPTGDLSLIIQGDSYSGGTYNIYTEVAGVADRSETSKFPPRAIRTGGAYDTKIKNLNQGTYYFEVYAKDGSYTQNVLFQITGGKTTTIKIVNTDITFPE